MADEPTHHTTYQSRAAGRVRRAFSGLTFAAVAGGFTVPVAELDGAKPKPGDTLTTADGKRWAVTGVTPAGALYTLACEPEGGAT